MGHASCLGCLGVAQLMDSSADHRALHEKTARQLLWTSTHSFHGWTCSQCEWNFPLPTLLNDPEARPPMTAWQRPNSATTNAPTNSRASVPPTTPTASLARIRKLVTQGFKPKDAVELFLQEVALEYRNQPKVLAQAKTDAEDFLRRVRAGLI